ncbi:MAG: ArsR/SmtB family transcription factor [Nitrososphaeria archaeon]
MKAAMVVDRTAVELLSDPVNREIISRLIFDERSVSGLAGTMKLSPVSVWRRVFKMKSAGLIRQTRVERVNNLEKKYYWAAALLFVPPSIMIDINPTGRNLRQPPAIFSDIQMSMLRELMEIEVPEDAPDLMDRAVSVQLKKFVDTFLNERTVNELKMMKELLS